MMARVHASTLVIGALAWLAAEIAMLAGGRITVMAGTLATIALFVVAGGVWALKDEAGIGRAGRVGIVMVSFGTLSLGMVMIIILTAGVLGALASGEISYGDIVWTPFYLLALVFLVAGLIGFAFHYKDHGAAPGNWVAPAFWVLAAITGLRFFLSELAIVHGLANMGLAALLAVLGAAAVARGLKVRNTGQSGEPRG